MKSSGRSRVAGTSWELTAKVSGQLAFDTLDRSTGMHLTKVGDNSTRCTMLELPACDSSSLDQIYLSRGVLDQVTGLTAAGVPTACGLAPIACHY